MLSQKKEDLGMLMPLECPGRAGSACPHSTIEGGTNFNQSFKKPGTPADFWVIFHGANLKGTDASAGLHSSVST
jgi:hypothetical protein